MRRCWLYRWLWILIWTESFYNIYDPMCNSRDDGVEHSGKILSLVFIWLPSILHLGRLDAGIVVSHIALVVGCACPLWIHQLIQLRVIILFPYKPARRIIAHFGRLDMHAIIHAMCCRSIRFRVWVRSMAMCHQIFCAAVSLDTDWGINEANWCLHIAASTLFVLLR